MKETLFYVPFTPDTYLEVTVTAKVAWRTGVGVSLLEAKQTQDMADDLLARATGALQQSFAAHVRNAPVARDL